MNRSRPRFDRVFARLVPSEYLAMEGGARALGRTFAIAVAIRLVLMPIACHSDLISTYHRAYTALNSFHPRYWLPHELIQAFVLMLVSPFLALDEMLVWEGAKHTASMEFWLETFAPHPQVFLALFLFKLPYLFCDLAIALVLLRLFCDAPARGLRAVSMWLLNPITIFVFYVFGRHDSVAILLVAFALLGIHRSRPLAGAFALGLAIWSRYWPVFLLPFLVLFASGAWRKRLQLVVLALVPILLFNIGASFGGAGFVKLPAAKMARSTFASYLTDFNVEMGWAQTLFVFPVVYALLLMFASVAKPRGDMLVRLSAFGFVCLSLLYATAFFHPQYFTWCLLFLVILRASSNSVVLRNLHYMQILLMVPYTFYWKKTLFGFLLAPLDPDFFRALPAPADWLAAFGSPLIFVNLARTLLSTICVFMAGWVLFEGDERVAQNDASTSPAGSMAAAR